MLHEKSMSGDMEVSTSTAAALFLECLDRPENRYGRYGCASLSSMSMSTVGVDGARFYL